MATTPQNFVQIGQQLVTELIQNSERLASFAATFEARGGGNFFDTLKMTADGDGELDEGQIQFNAALDKLKEDATFIVYINNDLQDFLTADRRATLNRLRTDY